MYLSGSVGYTLLEKDNKFIFLLADIHDGVNYCKQNSVMIASYLDKISNNNVVLLEEIIENNFKLEDLWPTSKHTKELKKLNNDNDKIIPIDIRPMLIPFSWELVENNNKLGKMILLEYIKLLDDFFKTFLTFSISRLLSQPCKSPKHSLALISESYAVTKNPSGLRIFKFIFSLIKNDK